MFNQYPYLNINDLNLDFILNAIREMKYEVTNFVSINAIKYADPIQWNITSQYEKNTIVIDPVTGTAYISVAPVPSGVSLTRPEYWTVVFDLGSFVTRAAQNFTSHWESETTTTATFPTSTGGWLVWGDVLYKALTNITAGDTYVVGGNIEHFTIEDLYNAYLNTIADILAIVGDLADLNTSDTTSIVNAINSVIVDLSNKIEMEVNGHAPVNVLDFGVVGDGVTDDSAALQAIVDEYDYIYIPPCTILISAPIVIDKSIEIRGAGNWNSKIVGNMQNGATMLDLTSSNARGSAIRNLSFFNNDNDVITIDIGVGQGIIENCYFTNWNTGIRLNNSSNESILNCLFTDGFDTGVAVLVGDSQYTTGVNITNCNIFGSTVAPYPDAGVKLDYVDGVNIDNCILNNCKIPLVIAPTVAFAHSIRVSNTLIDGGKQYGCRLISDSKEIYCVSFTGCWFTASGNDYGLQLSGNEYIQNVSISNCEFLSGYGGFASSSDNCYDISIIGCKFSGITNTAINVGRGKHLTIVGNNLNNTKYLNNAAPQYGLQFGLCEDVILANNISTNAQTLDLFINATAAPTTYMSNNEFATTNYHTSGATAQRPSVAPIGAKYFDTDENRELYWNGSAWVHSVIAASGTGHPAGIKGMIFYHDTLKSFRFYNGTSWGMGYGVGYNADIPAAGTQYGDEFYNRDVNMMTYYGNNGWVGNVPSFTTASRPTDSLQIGMCIFDTTLGKPIWFKGSGVWVDATGISV